jgi:hypothetical protein
LKYAKIIANTTIMDATTIKTNDELSPDPSTCETLVLFAVAFVALFV